MDLEYFNLNEVESIFVEDDTYENIDAPKWIDFAASDEPIDDDSWFCNPGCRHPKTAEDFLKLKSYSKVKHLRSATISEFLPFMDRDRRDVKLKGREVNTPNKFHEDGENRNPNFTTPPLHNKPRSKKTTMKPSAEMKKEFDNNSSPNSLRQEEKRQLKSTFSARNLFAGRDILNQITEFCSELKKLATKSPMTERRADESHGGFLSNLKDRVRKREKMPLLSRENYRAMEEGKQRKEVL